MRHVISFFFCLYVHLILVDVFELVAVATVTTAAATVWVLVTLCNQPKEIQAEIDAFIKTHGREHLLLFMSAIKECLCLHHIAPLALIRQTSDDVTCRSYFIPKGTILRQKIYVMNHHLKGLS
ncbi:hypothetical protein O0I10_005649 [Lichtheimia ornata]|uniref:Uncharacterized protein n=1 Tax=Lichtheimia ornata TaxID=688661 RepID=A0AAD7XVI9_9FUNG|nr:uncharacterized protein O0I10_005649 [Lichtheimia ornata]KAJ8658609.1 hypothetical protein O0I10_005649 [Lichtheimia ornata]